MKKTHCGCSYLARVAYSDKLTAGWAMSHPMDWPTYCQLLKSLKLLNLLQNKKTIFIFTQQLGMHYIYK